MLYVPFVVLMNIFSLYTYLILVAIYISIDLGGLTRIMI